MSRAPSAVDPRKRRTRDELLAAFFSLVLSRRYHEIRVADVLALADVGRSTFYEHFRSKDDLLFASLQGPFSVLGGMVGGDVAVHRISAILEHFWENRALARGLFQGATLRVVRRALVAHVVSCIERDDRVRLRIPPQLAAHALADGMLSPIIAWLAGEARCSALDLALALRDATAASMRAMQVA